LSEARHAEVRDGRFDGAECGITAFGMVIYGGYFSGPDLLRSSLRAVILGGTMTGNNVLAEATEARVMTHGTIGHLGKVLSGVIAARRIEAISPDLVVSEGMIIMAEETGMTDERVILLPPGTIQAGAPADTSQALSRLQSLIDTHAKRE
jgi:hypothetical protein